MSENNEITRGDCALRIRSLRESTGMNRKEFCARLGIPYQTVTDWELGHRHAPEYVIRLLEYYVRKEGLEPAAEHEEDV